MTGRRRRGRRGGRSNGNGETRDDQRTSPATADVPGLGDQPVVDLPIEPVATGPDSVDLETMDSDQPQEVAVEQHAPAPRRERWSKSRRDRDERRPKGNGEQQNEHRDDVDSAPAASEPSVSPSASASTIVEDLPAEQPAPRKWQPPAPTVTAASGERKSGWWSKR